LVGHAQSGPQSAITRVLARKSIELAGFCFGRWEGQGEKILNTSGGTYRPPLFWVKKEEMTEGRKASSARKTK